jgi:serine/threonine protein kinase
VLDRRAERVAELVKSAVECGPERWVAFLDEECESDPAMRAEIESLLQECDGASQFLAEPALHLAAESFAREGASRAGQTIGDYELVSLIGSGGMGEVYLAKDRGLHRNVALKLIRRGMASDDIIQHFKREEHLLASLNHSNIAQLYGGGVTRDGVPFFAMEYVEGERLDQYCDERGLATKERLQLFRKVCSAVTYAHQHLVIHRDLKPANIRVTAEGEPKLLDFGIAKLLESKDAQDSAQTLTLQGVMTPEYASPEQVAGGSITTSSDIYSLGVILYKLLTGQSPYRTITNRPEEIARAITEQEPTRPSTAISKSISTSNHESSFTPHDSRSLRGDLDNIVLMAMRKEPSRRYASAGQFSEDIRRHLEGLPVIARKDTVAYRASKFVSRHRIGVAAAALVLLSLIGGIFATLIQVRTARRERARAEAISGFLQKTLNASNPDRSSGGPPTVNDILGDASKRLASEELADQPEVRAELQRIIGESYLSLGQYDLAQQNLTAALQTQARGTGTDGIAALRTRVSLASLWAAAKGDYAKANAFYEANLPRLRAEQKQGTISTNYLTSALNGFALLRRAQGDSKEAETLLREELTLLPFVSPEQENNTGVAQAILALTLADQGKFDEAIRIVREKIITIRGKKQEGSAELAANLTGLGSFLLENGQTGESLENLREAEGIYRKLYSDANLQLGDNLRLQAQALYAESNQLEAEVRINETLKIYRAATGPQFINYATALMVQGMIFSQTSRTDEAEKLLREALRIRTENMPETHFLRATANGALGEFLAAQKRFSEAEPFLLASHESLAKSQAANSPRTRRARQRLANLYDTWNKPERAAPYRGI